MDPNALSDVVSQDFSLIALFWRSDPFVKGVMIILALASVWSWAIAIDKWFGVMGVRSRAKRFEHAFCAPVSRWTNSIAQPIAAATPWPVCFAAGAREVARGAPRRRR